MQRYETLSRHTIRHSPNTYEILMILMTRSTMNCSKVEDHIVLSRSKWQVLDRLADVVPYEGALQLLSLLQRRLVILHHKIRRARLHDVVKNHIMLIRFSITIVSSSLSVVLTLSISISLIIVCC